MNTLLCCQRSLKSNNDYMHAHASAELCEVKYNYDGRINTHTYSIRMYMQVRLCEHVVVFSKMFMHTAMK